MGYKTVKRLQTFVISSIATSSQLTSQSSTQLSLDWTSYGNMKQVSSVIAMYQRKLKAKKVTSISQFLVKYNSKIKKMLSKKNYTIVTSLDPALIQAVVDSYVTFQQSALLQIKLQKQAKKSQKALNKALKKAKHDQEKAEKKDKDN